MDYQEYEGRVREEAYEKAKVELIKNLDEFIETIPTLIEEAKENGDTEIENYDSLFSSHIINVGEIGAILGTSYEITDWNGFDFWADVEYKGHTFNITIYGESGYVSVGYYKDLDTEEDEE